jgi:hypothetical protein
MKRRDFLGLFGATLIASPRVSLGQTPAAPPTPKQLRIVVVANTYYEGDGLMTALCNRMARNAYVDVPVDVLWPRLPTTTTLGDSDKKPRCRLTVRAPAGNATAMVEIWCLDDLMPSNIVHGASDNKAAAMGIITAYGNGTAPDGVVAFGTAGYPDDISYDGCASVGSTIFIRDAAHDGGPLHSNWSWPNNMGVLVPSKTPATFFRNVIIDPQTVLKINSQMLSVPVNPSSKPRLVIASDAVAISSVNIPSGTEFGPVDLKAIAAAKAAGATNIASVETTHGVIRAQWTDAPFIFVTAIPNRVGHFSDEAGGNYPQEFASTHNAGIALNHVIPHFVGAIA